MFKKIVSILLAVVILLSVAAVSVFAEEDSSNSVGEKNYIYFDATGWNNYTTIYCHIWERGGDAFFPWQSRKEACVKDGSLYYYDLSNLDDSSYVSDGIQNGKDYCVIFCANTGVQTYEVTFGTDCIGDTVFLTDNKIENPIDSSKVAYEAVWTNNNSEYGPHLAITSIGNIVGSKLCPNEKGAETVGDWLSVYFYGLYVDVTATLVKAFPVFGIKTVEDVQTIYTCILENKDYYCITDFECNEIARILENAFHIAYPSLDESTGEAATTNPTETEQPTTAETQPATETTEPAETEPKTTEPEKKSTSTAKKDNKMKVTVKTKTVKAKKLKKTKVTVKAITVKKANGKVTYSKVAKKSLKCLTINTKTGKITVKKGTKKGKYNIKVKITAKGDKNYKSKTITKTVKIKVK